jgi:hypothetical protein
MAKHDFEFYFKTPPKIFRRRWDDPLKMVVRQIGRYDLKLITLIPDIFQMPFKTRRKTFRLNKRGK